MVDRIDIDVVKNFINGNGYSDQVSVIGHFSEITTQVHIIMTDCSCNDILVGYRLAEAIEARERFLVTGGFMFPDECCLFLHGIYDRHLKKDMANRWRFPFEDTINYRFLAHEVSCFKHFKKREGLSDHKEGRYD